MKKTAFLAITVCLLSISANAQDASKSNQNGKDVYTSLKPADATPAVFPTEQEMKEKKAFKMENIKLQIKENLNDTFKVRLLRYELWRFENAVVKTPVPSK